MHGFVSDSTKEWVKDWVDTTNEELRRQELEPGIIRRPAPTHHPPPLHHLTPPDPPEDLWLWKWDIKEFFPNLDRAVTLKSVVEIHKEVAARLRKRVRADGLFFAIHKWHKEWDRAERGGNDAFWNLSFAEVLNYVEWD